MLKRPGQALRIGVAASGLALAKTSRWGGDAVTVLAEVALAGAGEPEALADGLRRLLADAGAAGWPLTVVLSDDLVRLWQVTPPPACTRMADLEAAAALRFQSLFGASPAGWKLAAHWDAARPFLAAALPLPLLAVLEQAAREHRLHLVEIVPQFVAAMSQWRRLRRPGAWFGLVQGSVLTIAAFEGAALAAVRSALVPADAGRDWLESHIAREALRVGLERPERLQVCGPAPASWTSHPGRLKFGCSLLGDAGGVDLSPAARLAATGNGTRGVQIDFAAASLRRILFRTPPLGWALVFGALMLGVPAASAGWTWLHELRAYEAQLAAGRARASVPAVVPAAVRQAPVTQAQAGAVNDAILQLNLPWRELHDAVRAATPASVALLALEPDASKRTLRITAEARGSDEMIAYVEQIRRQEWFTAVTLARHEINELDPNRPLRFQLDAQWKEAR